MGLANRLLRFMFTRSFKARECSHLDQVQDVEPEADVCLKCVASGDTWPDLRLCLTCSHVGCCEDAKNQHALKHFQETGHPIVRPLKGGLLRNWMWCYIDNALLDLPE